MFPDAPTLRGIKHINELINCVEKGMGGYILFIVQLEGCRYFTPNVKTHPEFAQALKRACQKGVKVIALECKVTCDSMRIFREIEIRL